MQQVCAMTEAPQSQERSNDWSYSILFQGMAVWTGGGRIQILHLESHTLTASVRYIDYAKFVLYASFTLIT